MSKVFEALRRHEQENDFDGTSRVEHSDYRLERISVAGVHARLILLTEPDSAGCEQFRMLRTQLFHAAETRSLKLITLTSALAGEGKTSTLLNLALAIAQSKEKRVLVIDGDLRRPSVAAYLGIKPVAGLEEALTGSIEFREAVTRIDGSEIYVLPVTTESRNPTERLSSGRLGEILAELRDGFDFILIDSPPVMPFADARLLANHSDGVMMVVRAGLAPFETVEKALEILPADRMLGVVLNGADDQSDAGYYDYYYNYARRIEQDVSWRDRLKAMVAGRRDR